MTGDYTAGLGGGFCMHTPDVTCPNCELKKWTLPAQPFVPYVPPEPKIDISDEAWRGWIRVIEGDKDGEDRGWICPKCDKGKAPHVDTCDC